MLVVETIARMWAKTCELLRVDHGKPSPFVFRFNPDCLAGLREQPL